MPLILACREDNDLYRVLADTGITCARFDTAQQALEYAPPGAGLMALADGYPDALTPIDPAFYDTAAENSLRLYVEFPAAIPGQSVGEPRGITWERGVVASNAFEPNLTNLRILAIHGCRFIPVPAENPHIAVARVAGFDSAIYGLPQETFPNLYEHPRGNLLVSTTKLSQFVTARYAPVEAWRAIWRWILGWVMQGAAPQPLWTPTVRPSYAADDALPDDIEAQAFRRGVAWFQSARLLVHPSWEGVPERRLDALRHAAAGRPEPLPEGDGSRGMIEGASGAIGPDGCQGWSTSLRNDCMGEASATMALGEALGVEPRGKTIARNLNDYIYGVFGACGPPVTPNTLPDEVLLGAQRSPRVLPASQEPRHFNSLIAQGSRADPASPSYGLLSWGTLSPGVYYGDDNARSMLGTIAAAALLHTDRWDQGVLRCMLANLRTTGPQGFRDGRIDEEPLQENGWRHYWTTPRTHYAPHYEAWLWAALLWAYGRTGFAPFLERPRTALGLTMKAYPDEWRWTNGIQQERARMILPLAWLVRVEDTEEHRQWLRFMAQELLSHQDQSGAIREELGPPDKGSYGPPQSNEDYGTTEATLIQANGDPVCDLLYTTNFAFVGLHEAAAATGEPLYAEAEDRLARFLCRIQVRSELRPELDGGWFRAFEFRQWDYWGSSADLGWGVWSIESGWTQAWIASVLALRQLRTSLWELTANSAIRRHLNELVAIMLPECASP